MTPSLRTMPTIDATFDPRARRWLVRLPGGYVLHLLDERAVAEEVRHHAPGSAVRYLRDASEGELRELWGGR